MTTRPVDSSSADTSAGIAPEIDADAVETDFSVPADADLRPSPVDGQTDSSETTSSETAE